MLGIVLAKRALWSWGGVAYLFCCVCGGACGSGAGWRRYCCFVVSGMGKIGGGFVEMGLGCEFWGGLDNKDEYCC